jgi:adenylate cyclase
MTTRMPRHPHRSGWRSSILALAIATTLSIYLFVDAPPPLQAEAATERRPLSIESVFALLELENDVARALWTEEIVNRGAAVGLAFGERWREPAVPEGPLPALFLRETARHLERATPGLKVFLGSGHPINAANRLTGRQAGELAELERTGEPRFFFEDGARMHTGMFADRAIVEGCVHCHNEHRESPKTDWRLGDVMGATTWMYPDAAVSVERAVELIGALRASIRAAYERYLEKAATLPRAPVIGQKWPRDGYFLPTADAFMAELARRSAPITMQGLIDPASALAAAAADPIAHAATPPPAAPAPGPVAAPEATSDAVRAPTLVIRSRRTTRVTVDREDARLMVTRLPAGGSASLTSRPPLRVRLSRGNGVDLEYDGRSVPVPAAGEAEGEVEITLPAVREKS